jgi:membrane carboxypeptidase/penicillin-binding protein PbpC
VGNADNSAMRQVSGVDGAAPIWRDVMETALKGVTPVPLTVPQGIRELTVCVPSGLLPTKDCPRRRIEKFADGTEPVLPDDYYRSVRVCSDAPVVSSATDGCPGRFTEKVYAFLPLEAIPWARSAGVPLPPVPPYTSSGDETASAATTASAAGVTLVSPANGTVLRISREIPLDDQALRIEALPSGSARYVELYVDGAPVAHIEESPYRNNWQLTEGTHEIRARAVDSAGNALWSKQAIVTVLPPEGDLP